MTVGWRPSYWSDLRPVVSVRLSNGCWRFRRRTCGRRGLPSGAAPSGSPQPTWTGGRVKLDLFGHLPTQVLADLEREARDVERFVAPH